MKLNNALGVGLNNQSELIMLVLNFPIEPMENRYSVQWDKWFREAFTRNEIPFVTMTGHKIVQNAPKDGFNNPISSMKFKFSQLEQAMNVLTYRSPEEKIVFFFQDGWMPGSECVPYIRALMGRQVRIAAFWHAGGYLGTDILNQQNQTYWSDYSEKSWLRMASKIFLGSHYHLDLMAKNCDLLKNDKFVVTGCPVEVPQDVKCWGSGPTVVFPHRLSSDKHPEIFDRLAAEPQFKGVHFIKTMEHCENKADYYDTLHHSHVAVSCATHETFGIAMAEAALCGCWPVYPNELSYPEVFGGPGYHDYDGLVSDVELALSRGTEGFRPLSFKSRIEERYNVQKVTDHICKEIQSIYNEPAIISKSYRGY